MSNKHRHIQDSDVTPTEATKNINDWINSDIPSSTRQDEDRYGSHVHYQLLEDDNRTVKPDSTGQTDIVQRIKWPE